MKKAPILLTGILGLLLMAAPSAASMGYSALQPMEADEALAWLEEHAPKIAEDMKVIYGIAPDIYAEILEEATIEIPEGEEMRRTEPEFFEYLMETDEMEVRSIRLAVELAVEKNARKQESMKKEIKSLVEKVFDRRLEEHQIIVDEIEKELAELKKAGKIRKQNRQKVIGKRYEELVDPNSQALEWW